MPPVGFFLCLFSALVGFSGFVAFLVLGNLPACVWAFTSGIVNSMATHLYWLRHKSALEDWYSNTELYPLSIVGCVAFTCGIIGVVYHSTIEILQKTPILPINKSQVIAIVWAALTAKSGIILLCTCRRFRNIVILEEESAIVANIQDGNGEEVMVSPEE